MQAGGGGRVEEVKMAAQLLVIRFDLHNYSIVTWLDRELTFA